MFPPNTIRQCVEAMARSALLGLRPARASSSAIAACVPQRGARFGFARIGTYSLLGAGGRHGTERAWNDHHHIGT